MLWDWDQVHKKYRSLANTNVSSSQLTSSPILIWPESFARKNLMFCQIINKNTKYLSVETMLYLRTWFPEKFDIECL